MLAGIFAILIAAAGAALLMLLLGKPTAPGGMPGRERANRPSAAAYSEPIARSHGSRR